MAHGNLLLSPADVLEYIVHERIALLYRQANSCLSRSDYSRLLVLINNLSKRWGVEAEQDLLDIAFSRGELVSHPFVRYLNERNTIIFDKIAAYSKYIQTGLFSKEAILELSSYAQEEYIPSLTLDNFFSNDINALKHALSVSIRSKAVSKLIKFANVQRDTDGGTPPAPTKERANEDPST
jgi:hypothetical protein